MASPRSPSVDWLSRPASAVPASSGGGGGGGADDDGAGSAPEGDAESTSRRITIVPGIDAVVLPEEPDGIPDPAVQAKVAMYLQKGRSLVDNVHELRNFRNPTLYTKLIELHGLDEFGSNYPRDKFDRKSLDADATYDRLGTFSPLPAGLPPSPRPLAWAPPFAALPTTPGLNPSLPSDEPAAIPADRQKKRMEQKEKDRMAKSRTEISFVSKGAADAPPAVPTPPAAALAGVAPAPTPAPAPPLRLSSSGPALVIDAALEMSAVSPGGSLVDTAQRNWQESAGQVPGAMPQEPGVCAPISTKGSSTSSPSMSQLMACLESMAEGSMSLASQNSA